MKSSLARAFLPLLALCSLTACDDDAGEVDASMAPSSNRGDAGNRSDAGPDERVRMLVGALSDSDVKIGVIATALRARLFFCGGPDSVETMTRWVVADLDQGWTVELVADDWEISGQLDGEELIGELKREGEETATFIASLIDADTLAGVYEGMDQCGRVGLIVTQPSQNDVATAQGACVGMGHLPEQVTALLPVTRERDGSIIVELEGDDGPRLASVIEAAAPE